MFPFSLGSSLGSAAGNIFGSIFGSNSQQDPAAAAMPYFNQAGSYLNQIPDALKQYLNPYIQGGQQAMPTLMSQYNQLLNNPTAIMKSIGSQYQASPGYQFNVDQATKAANQAAAAGGMVGSPQEQQQLAQTISGIASQDYNNFMNQGLGLYGQGLQGWGGINQLGYGASNNMAQSLKDMYESQAQLAQNQAQMQYANTQNQNQQKGGFWGSIGSAIGNLF